MFAYCLNNPANYTDEKGTDAVWIQEGESAGGAGHSGLLVQNKEGHWWYFYWGPNDENANVLVMATFGVPSKCVLLGVDVSGSDLSSVEDVSAILAQVDDDNETATTRFVAKRADKVTGVIYFEGDFTNTLFYLFTLKQAHENMDYHLFFNNCVQKTWIALSFSSNIFDNYFPLIPDNAYIRAKEIAEK